MSVLGVFAADPDREYFGLELAGVAGLRPATVYPIAIRFEAEGRLVSRWDTLEEATREKRRPRKYYRLRAEAVPWAESELAAWQRQQRTLARRSSIPHVNGALT